MLDKKFQVSSLILIFYLILIGLYYFLFISNYFNLDSPSIILDADSFTYIQLNELYSDITILLALNLNTLGPLIVLRLLNGSILLIFLFNTVIFVTSFYNITSVYKLNNKEFILLLVLNPLFIPVLTTLNKEIFGFASVVYIMMYLKGNKSQDIIAAFLFGFLCRWQMIFVVIFFFIFRYITKKIHLTRTIAIILFLFMISFLYPIFFQQTISSIADTTTLEQQQVTAGPVINALNLLQNHYLYFIAVIPKAFFNLIGNVVRIFTVPYNLIFLGEKDYYNNIFLLGHQLMMLILITISLLKNKLYRNKDLLLFMVLYVIIFSLGPLIQYRYLFPIYVIFCVTISEYKFNVASQKKNHNQVDYIETLG